MCLSIKFNTNEMTAKEDITVYKRMFAENISPYLQFKYMPNTLYRLKKKLVNLGGCIEHGYHSYLNKDTAEHNRFVYEKIVKMIIPKGAKYYLGDEGDIVSTSIRTGNLRAIK